MTGEVTVSMPIRGTIVRLMYDKGFGFIRRQGGVEYFFHRSALVDLDFNLLQTGQLVTFEEGSGLKGPRASKVLAGYEIAGRPSVL